MRTPEGTLIAHADHGLEQSHLAFIDTLLKGWDGTFVIMHEDLPDECPSLLSGLYGPAAGDEPVAEEHVFYEKRGNRPGPSRIIEMPERPCRKLVVIAGPGREETMIFTAYGSPAQAPREWWDVSMKPHEAIVAATFWSQHALASG